MVGKLLNVLSSRRGRVRPRMRYESQHRQSSRGYARIRGGDLLLLRSGLPHRFLQRAGRLSLRREEDGDVAIEAMILTLRRQ